MTCFPDRVLESEAYLSLTVHERAVLTEIARRFNGWNNGSIAVSQRQMMKGLNTTSPKTIIQAVARLMEHGLIAVEVEGEWKPRMARQFRLTWINTTPGGRHKQATNDYLHFDASRKIGDARQISEPAPSGEARTSKDLIADIAQIPSDLPNARISAQTPEPDLIKSDVARASLIDNHTPAQDGHTATVPRAVSGRRRDYICV